MASYTKDAMNCGGYSMLQYVSGHAGFTTAHLWIQAQVVALANSRYINKLQEGSGICSFKEVCYGCWVDIGQV